MQTLRIRKGQLKSSVLVPPSKSYANRALILASIHGNCSISNLPQATDVQHLLDCLKEIGLLITQSGTSVVFQNHFPACETSSQEPITLNVGEGGTTGRFLAALVLLGRRKYLLKLGHRLSERPWDEFISIARKFGGEVSLEGQTLSLRGPIKLPANLEIDCSRTTQFATAFQLLSSVTKSCTIPLHLSSSQSYWEMTEKLLKGFPASSYVVPADWSSASYPMAFAALNHDIMFPGLQFDQLQADAKFLNVLKTLGAVKVSAEGIHISKISTAKDIQLDVSDCLDLVPTLAYFLGNLPGEHQLTGVQNLVHKESDRLNEVRKLLSAFGRASHTSGRKLTITGNDHRLTSETKLELPDDHRLVMAGSLFLLHHGGGTVTPAEAVTKSYPDFFSLISS